MLSHLSLKFRTDSEGLQQQEILDSLPKAIRSSISHFLFHSLVDKVYLFRGVSDDLLFQLVSEMRAEYYPPNEDVILQNEAPTDFYILATGAVELLDLKNGVQQVMGEAKTGELCGEIGVLCYWPQLFTVRTKRLTQLLRLNRTTFLNIVQANVEDGTIIMNNLLQHLKELKDPIMEGILREIESMLARGRMDIPLTLCFAAQRGDELLLHHLLKRGLDPNETDSNGRTALHFAAAKGYENCVLLLLDHGADPNCRDSEGSVPLWEAMLGGHKTVIELLSNNGAKITTGDVGLFCCTAAEQNNLNLLKEIVGEGGDVSQPKSNGQTSLHVGVCEGNLEIVKFLLNQGANINAPDENGWTSRKLPEQQGHEDIIELLRSFQGTRLDTYVNITDEQPGVGRFLGRFKSEPAFLHLCQEGSIPKRRRKSYNNSLFGIMSAAQSGDTNLLLSVDKETPVRTYVARVTVSCPEKGDVAGKIILRPQSFEQLLEIGLKRYGVTPTRVLSRDGAEVDDIELVRDGDHLVFTTLN